MQICLLILTAFFWTYTIYFVIGAMNSNVKDRIWDLLLDIFASIVLFFLGLIFYIISIRLDEPVQRIQETSEMYYY